MICVYDGLAERDYTQMGDAVLLPTECTWHQVAGGEYNLKMIHPIDRAGQWRYLKTGNIIKAPVVEEEIENAYTGQDMWIYYTAGSTSLRETPQDPETISYPAWVSDGGYTVGSKVSNSGRAWRCDYYDERSSFRFYEPPRCVWWSQIPNRTSGGTVVASLPAGTKLIWVSGSYADTWWQMSTFAGVTGWIKQSDLTGEEHRTQEEVQPVKIRDQLFRINNVEINATGHTVTVQADHVSYDANGSLVWEAKISQASPALAIQLMQDGLYEPYTVGTISNNLTTTDDGTYTQTIKNKSLISCLLDPSIGIVPTFDAAYKRNNWDLYILQKTDTDRGYAIRYGLNAKGITWKRDITNLVTRIIPIAKGESGDDLFLPEVYVDSPNINLYPVIRMEVLNVSGQVGKDDGTGSDTVWTEAALLDEMRAKAQERFDVDHVDLETVDVTVDFILLGDTAEFPDLKRLQNVIMYDIVHAYDSAVGLDLALRVVEMEYDAIRERITGIKLSNVSGYSGKSVAGYMMVHGSVTSDIIAGQTMDSIVAAAADRAIKTLS